MARAPSTEKKKTSKIAAVPTHVPLEALYLVVGGLIVPPKENAVCTEPFQKGVSEGEDP